MFGLAYVFGHRKPEYEKLLEDVSGFSELQIR
jgi:hypothetical protein